MCATQAIQLTRRVTVDHLVFFPAVLYGRRMPTWESPTVNPCMTSVSTVSAPQTFVLSISLFGLSSVIAAATRLTRQSVDTDLGPPRRTWLPKRRAPPHGDAGHCSSYFLSLAPPLLMEMCQSDIRSSNPTRRRRPELLRAGRHSGLVTRAEGGLRRENGGHTTMRRGTG
jgi:hypothetical protein